MKREGRQQHGLVRSNVLPSKGTSCSSSYKASSSSTRAFNQFDSRSDSRAVINQFNVRPTAGLLPKMQTKPKNQTIFFGRNGKTQWTACHVFPTAKSKEKIKGTQKLRSKDVGINHKLVSCCAVNKGQGLNYRGVSATAVLGQLSSDYLDDDDDDLVHDDGHDDDDVHHHHVYDNDYDDHVNDVYNVYDDDDFPVLADELTIRVVREEGENSLGKMEDEYEEEDDDHMSFCDVGFVIDQIDGDGGEDEDWCLVGEL